MKKFFSQFEDNFCALILALMTILTFFNVIARYIFKSSMPFVEELTATGLIILSLMGAALAAKRKAHLGLTIITDHLPENIRRFIEFIGNLLGALMGGLILYYGFLMTKQEYTMNVLSSGMRWPEWRYGMFVPISGAVLLIRYIQLSIKSLKKKEGDK